MSQLPENCGLDALRHADGSHRLPRTRATALTAQGFRCGHLDGSKRVGSYVLGEESDWDLEAARAARSDWPRDRGARELEQADWAYGYRMGYVAGASGEAVPECYQLEHGCPLPEEVRT